MPNNCKTIIQFTCGTPDDSFDQPNCKHFKQHPDCPSTVCKYGLPQRKCLLVNANMESLFEEIKDIEYVTNKLMGIPNEKH
jgi:hypothetical protein